jgi:hypothetical protein
MDAPISQFSEKHEDDLLAMKKRLGLPDIRLDTSRMKKRRLPEKQGPGAKGPGKRTRRNTDQR